jgi:hypothetical protein
MMTRKDYVKTAEILNSEIQRFRKDEEENSMELFFALQNVQRLAVESVQFIAEQFAEFFASDNPRFNEEKFFDAVWSELNV